MPKVLLRTILGTVSGLILLVGLMGPGQPDDPPHRTGLVPLSAEELAQVLSTRPQVTRVHLNWLGLERVNKVRTRKGLPPLDPASARSLGRELESVVGGRAADAQILDEAAAMAADLPVAVDNSRLKYFPPIRDQGPLGSCAAFAATY